MTLAKQNSPRRNRVATPGTLTRRILLASVLASVFGGYWARKADRVAATVLQCPPHMKCKKKPG